MKHDLTTLKGVMKAVYEQEFDWGREVEQKRKNDFNDVGWIKFDSNRYNIDSINLSEFEYRYKPEEPGKDPLVIKNYIGFLGALIKLEKGLIEGIEWKPLHPPAPWQRIRDEPTVNEYIRPKDMFRDGIKFRIIPKKKLKPWTPEIAVRYLGDEVKFINNSEMGSYNIYSINSYGVCLVHNSTGRYTVGYNSLLDGYILTKNNQPCGTPA